MATSATLSFDAATTDNAEGVYLHSQVSACGCLAMKVRRCCNTSWMLFRDDDAFHIK